MDVSKVHCHGFPNLWLPMLIKAINDNQVVWLGADCVIGVYWSEFEWMKLRFRIIESLTSEIYSIKLLSGTPTEDLTLAILRG